MPNLFNWLRRSDLDSLSAAEASRLSSEVYRRNHEPEMREVERRLGTPNWESLSWYELLRRSVERDFEGKRSRYLREAAKLGLEVQDGTSTSRLSWMILEERVRRNDIKEIRKGRGGV